MCFTGRETDDRVPASHGAARRPRPGRGRRVVLGLAVAAVKATSVFVEWVALLLVFSRVGFKP
jgi:hypothetical protein